MFDCEEKKNNSHSAFNGAALCKGDIQNSEHITHNARHKRFPGGYPVQLGYTLKRQPVEPHTKKKPFKISDIYFKYTYVNIIFQSVDEAQRMEKNRQKTSF